MWRLREDIVWRYREFVWILCEGLDIVIYEDPAKVVGGGKKRFVNLRWIPWHCRLWRSREFMVNTWREKRVHKKRGARTSLFSFVNVLWTTSVVVWPRSQTSHREGQPLSTQSYPFCFHRSPSRILHPLSSVTPLHLWPREPVCRPPFQDPY